MSNSCNRLDPIAPTVAIASVGGLPNHATRTITGTTADAELPIAVDDGNSVLGVLTADAAGVWSKSFGLISTQKGPSIAAMAFDAAGNVGTNVSAAYTSGTISPVAPNILLL